MKALLALFFFGVLVGGSFYAFSKEEAGAKTPEKKDGMAAKKNYTEEEFKQKVQDEVKSMMKKTGSGHLVDFSKDLLEKEDQIKMKELELKKQEEELKLSRADFQKKVVEFEETQKKFLGCVDGQKEKTDKRVSQMVEIISSMKPQNAADVLSIQDPELSVRILGQIDSQKASKIFNLMTKEVSAKLQKQYVEMKK